MKIEIDKKSGFCFGVVNAIKIAEQNLMNNETLYCLGDIVHNDAEIGRLSKMGLIYISKQEYFNLRNASVLIRAHGEPPETYQYARENNIELIEATCPVVLKLQQSIKKSYDQIRNDQGQLLILGKPGHAEIIGLNGQTGNNAIIIESKDDLNKVDFSKPVILYSQTTKSIDEFREISGIIREKIDPNVHLKVKDSICRQVANRIGNLRSFSEKYDVIIFVAGGKSSNGKFLFSVCRDVNPKTYNVASSDELNADWFQNANSVGICGATSTPFWLMEEVAEKIKTLADFAS